MGSVNESNFIQLYNRLRFSQKYPNWLTKTLKDELDGYNFNVWAKESQCPTRGRIPMKLIILLETFVRRRV